MKKNNVELICDIGELANLFRDTDNVSDFLQKVTVTVSKHLRCDACSIFLYDDKEQKLILKATQGLNKKSIDTVKLSPGEGITGISFKEMRPIREAKASANPAYRHFPGIKEELFEAFLAMPILRGQERIGVLVVQHRKTGYFDEVDTKALKAISAQLASTLENVKLLMGIQLTREIPNESAPTADHHLLKGRVASEGIAMGRAVVLGLREAGVFLEGPPTDNYRSTLKDFRDALKNSEDQINGLQKEMEAKLSDVASLIFSTHILMLKDPSFSGVMEEEVQKGIHPALAITQVVNEYVQIFSQSPNPRLKEKVQDVKDLGHRLLRNLSKDEVQDGDYTGQVVVARELLPSELIKISAQEAEGLLLFGAGASAHVSILARSLGIPVIFSSDEGFKHIAEEDFLILDGYQGNVLVNPLPKVVKDYQTLKEDHLTADAQASLVKDKTLTKDNHEIKLLANINLLSDVRVAENLKAQGIGLYRSEFPFIIRNDFPTEEEQYRVYRKIITSMAGKEVVLRTLDIGGDKVLSYLPQGTESNPFLGLRAIRFSLQNVDIFHDQLRAMLRAGKDEDLRILFPLISSLDDFLEARDHVRACVKELQEEEIPHNSSPKIGAMIELPSACEVARELAHEADFLTVGTNDLVQYILGVDRTNEAVSHFYTAYHPAVLRVLQRVVRAAVNADCPLSICGEIAADPLMIPFLIGAGIRKLSVNPKLIPQVQKTIETLSYRDCLVLADRLVTKSTVKEVHEALGVPGATAPVPQPFTKAPELSSPIKMAE